MFALQKMIDEFIGRRILGPDNEFYEIKEFVGKGAMGRVYRAVGENSRNIVAIKISLDQNEFDSPSFALRSLSNEQKMALLGINHPNVLTYLYVNNEGDDETSPYVVTEFIEGGTLEEFIKRLRAENQELTLGDALDLMRQIAAGMQAINGQVIHRDMKPGNILLARKNDKFVPKIADFGVAKIAVDPTRDETFKGVQTILYMAPEVWNQERQTIKVDVYSVGLLFYELLLLKHPLIDQMNDPFDLHEWRTTHLNRVCPNIREIRADIDQSVAEILFRMTAKRPANRPEWEEIVRVLNFEQPQIVSPEVDPEILQAIRNQAEERVRKTQAEETSRLIEEETAERRRLEREDYSIAFQRLISQFDAIIEAINEHTPIDKIIISTDSSNQKYKMPNGRILSVSNFGMASSGARVLGGGLMSVEGGLSANLMLNGSRENIAEGTWNAVEVIIMPLFGGDRLDLYRRAGIDDATIRYVEFLDHGETWRRDLPGFFGIRNRDLFFSKVGSGAVDVYQLSTRDLINTFNQIVKVALRMPATR